MLFYKFIQRSSFKLFCLKHKATQIYLIVLPNRRRKFPKIAKKLKFQKLHFYFFRRRGFIHFKVKKK